MTYDNLRPIQFVWDEKGTHTGVGLMEKLMNHYHIPGEVWDWSIRNLDGSETTYLESGKVYMFVRIFRNPEKESKSRLKVSS